MCCVLQKSSVKCLLLMFDPAKDGQSYLTVSLCRWIDKEEVEELAEAI